LELLGLGDQTNPGRPPGSVKGLLYNRRSNTLVAVLDRRPDSGPPVKRLYYRRLPGDDYRPVDVRHEFESQETAHCCEGSPYLVFNEMRFEEPESPRIPTYLEGLLKDKHMPPQVGWGADWLGIRRFDLETGEDARVLVEETLRPPPPYTTGWVSGILSVRADGSGAVCTAGFMPGGGVDYYVVEVSFTGGVSRVIAKLPHVFL
jgi:hypothetical protein